MNDYEKLGLKEGASKEAIQQAYRVRLLRYQQLGENKSAEEEEAFKEIDEAYNRLCGYDIPLEEEKHGKLKNFLYYNKEKIIIIAFVIFLIVMLVTQVANKEVYDFSIAIIGDFETKSEDESVDVPEKISKLMLQEIVGIENPIVTVYPRGGDILQDNHYMTLQQKLILEMEFGEVGIDLMILDEENYTDFLEKEYLYAMDDFISVYEEGNQSIPEELLIKDTADKVYGIRLSGNSFIEECNFTYTGDLVACIFVRSQRKELAFAGIQAISGQFEALPLPDGEAA